MVVDASVVVLENIFRHYTNDRDKNSRQAASLGAREVALATTAGMLTTVIVLIPVMFAGGYTEQTMRPLSMMIVVTLVASLIAALTIVPLMASRMLKHGTHKPNRLERIFSKTDVLVSKLGDFYIFLLTGALRMRWLVVVIALVFLAFTMKQVKPLLGGELMPKMDTGIVNLVFETPSEYTPDQVKDVLTQVETAVYQTDSVVSVSSTVGSEPGEISFGGGGSPSQSVQVKVNLKDRLHRKDDIWKIQDDWRARLQKIKGLKNFQISEYGATPVSTTRAPLDIIISGSDPEVLDRLGNQVMMRLNGIPGLVDVKRSWDLDKPDCQIKIDPNLAALYQMSQSDVARELKTAVKGVSATAMRLNGFLDIPVFLRYADSDISSPDQLAEVPIQTPVGQVPLRAMAKIDPYFGQPFITREELRPTLDITGVNRGHTIGHVTGMVQKKLATFDVPDGYRVQVSGTAVDMKTGQAEMGNALKIGIILLLILLLAMFKSFLHPFTIMAAIPLAVAGGFWGLLLFDKPMCKPAMMGMILLGGTVVNNSILILDFIINARAEGMSKNDAIVHAVRLRLRPILMTTVSTIIGLTPLIFELAVGLERMSPLGIVAATGLLVGTFLTMIVIPVVYSLMDSLGVNTRKLFGMSAG
jgi:multidrug efflux pump subunit AcrB